MPWHRRRDRAYVLAVLWLVAIAVLAWLGLPDAAVQLVEEGPPAIETGAP